MLMNRACTQILATASLFAPLGGVAGVTLPKDAALETVLDADQLAIMQHSSPEELARQQELYQACARQQKRSKGQKPKKTIFQRFSGGTVLDPAAKEAEKPKKTFLQRFACWRRKEARKHVQKLLREQWRFEGALAEIRSGRKTGHWSWYFLPTPVRPNASAKNRDYALKSDEDTEAFLAHPTLNANYVAMMNAVADAIRKKLAEPRFYRGGAVDAVITEADTPKLWSSVSHFAKFIYNWQMNASHHDHDHRDVGDACHRVMEAMAEDEEAQRTVGRPEMEKFVRHVPEHSMYFEEQLRATRMARRRFHTQSTLA